MSECYLEKIEPIKQIINGPNRDVSLNWRIWNGRVQISLFEGKGRPRFSKSINDELLVVIRNVINELRAAPPESKRPIVVSKFDIDSKKYNTDYVLIIGKDSSMVYYMELRFKDKQGEYEGKFTLKGPSGITIGSEPMKDGDKSSIKLQSFVDWLDKKVPMMQVLTNQKFDPNNRGGSRGGNASEGSSGSSSSGGDFGDDYF